MQNFLRSTASFRMTNEKLVPSEISKIINIVPDVSYEKGYQRSFVDKKGKSNFAMPCPTGMWSIESKQPGNETLDNHIGSLLLLLYPYKEKIIELSKNGYEMNIFCGVFSKSCHQPGFEISSDILKKLGEMNISFSVCFY